MSRFNLKHKYLHSLLTPHTDRALSKGPQPTILPQENSNVVHLKRSFTMAKPSYISSVEVSRELPREQRSVPVRVPTVKEPDNSLVNLLRQGMLFAQGQAQHDPPARASHQYEFVPFRSSAVQVSSSTTAAISPRAQQQQQHHQSIDELLEEVMQVISATDGAVDDDDDDDNDTSPVRRCRERGDGSASPDRGPTLPKQ
jgi:hypothetical protein